MSALNEPRKGAGRVMAVGWRGRGPLLWKSNRTTEARRTRRTSSSCWSTNYDPCEPLGLVVLRDLRVSVVRCCCRAESLRVSVPPWFDALAESAFSDLRVVRSFTRRARCGGWRGAPRGRLRATRRRGVRARAAVLRLVPSRAVSRRARQRHVARLGPPAHGAPPRPRG